MSVPEGYKSLGKIGISYKGDYNSNTAYERLDAVFHNGSTYLAIKDAPDGAPRDDKTNWIYLAKGYDGETVDVADSEIAFTDSETRENIVSGEKVSTVFGKIKKFFTDLTAPAFAQMITTKEDLLATKVTGYVPDAKAVADTYTELNRKLSVKFDDETNYLQVLKNGEWVNFAQYNTVVVTPIANNNYTVVCDLSYNPASNTIAGTITVTVKSANSNWVNVGNINILPTEQVVYGTYTSSYPELRIDKYGNIYCAGGTTGQNYTWNVSYKKAE